MTAFVKTLGQFVYDDLFQKINQGFFRPGQRLPSEEQLTAQYSVSRPVVRAALQKLRTDGFIESVKGVGSFVKRASVPSVIQMSPVSGQEDYLNCFEFRLTLEGSIAYYATLRANTADKIKIQKAFEATTQHRDVYDKNEMERDLAFHLAIAEATHNRFYVQALQAISIQVIEGMSRVTHHFEKTQSNYFAMKDREHSTLLEAILQGDAGMAKAALELHLNRSKHSIAWSLSPKK